MISGRSWLVARPRSLDEAVAILAENPDVTVVAGGTDAMVGVNDGRTNPSGWLSLRDVEELRAIEVLGDGSVSIGACVTMATLAADALPMLTAVASAARTIGSPQIRNMATIGGNLATGSPAGDTLPPLLCADATVELVSVASTRRVALADFLLAPKRTALRPGELIRHVTLPPRAGRRMFAKVGPRNAMVIAVCSLAVRFDLDTRDAAVAVGSVAPTALRLQRAEALLTNGAPADAFAEAVAAGAAPIDDVRATAAYRTHAIRVLARRAHRVFHEPDVGGRG